MNKATLDIFIIIGFVLGVFFLGLPFNYLFVATVILFLIIHRDELGNIERE